MTTAHKVLTTLLVADVLGINIWLGYSWWKTESDKKYEESRSQLISYNIIPTLPAAGKEDECGSECKAYVKEEIKTLKEELSAGPSASPKVVVVTPKPTARTKTRTVTYLSIPGTGSSGSTDWTSLAGTEFYFNTGDYPGLSEIYFEATMKLYNGNGRAYVRLFDATNGIGVQGSDASTASQSDTIVESGKVTFWAGRNVIKVQAKSLTADTAVFTSGRLRIVQEY